MNAQNLLDKIKPHARPTWGARIDEIAATAERNGWTVETLANEVNKGIGANTGTGYVVNTLERLATSKVKTNETNELITGACQLGCDHGWFNVEEDGATRALPCRSCKPDTYRRLKLANEARRNGANRDQIYQLISQNTLRVPHTYPITNQHPTTTHPPPPGLA